MKTLIAFILILFAVHGIAQDREKKANCSFSVEYDGSIISEGNWVEFNFKIDPNRMLYDSEGDSILAMLTEDSPDCVVSFYIDMKFEAILANTFMIIDQPTYFEIKTKLYYPNIDCIVKGKGYVLDYYRGVLRMVVLTGDAILYK